MGALFGLGGDRRRLVLLGEFPERFGDIGSPDLARQPAAGPRLSAQRFHTGHASAAGLTKKRAATASSSVTRSTGFANVARAPRHRIALRNTEMPLMAKSGTPGRRSRNAFRISNPSNSGMSTSLMTSLTAASSMNRNAALLEVNPATA